MPAIYTGGKKHQSFYSIAQSERPAAGTGTARRPARGDVGDTFRGCYPVTATPTTSEFGERLLMPPENVKQ
jgi:hypothetical protein